MLVPCEAAVKIVLPSIRAMIANELRTRYGLTQTEAGKQLGISQAAICLYQKKLRGASIKIENDPEIKVLVTEYVDSLMNDDLSHNLSRRQKLRAICEICRIIRFKRYLCQIHKNLDPTIDTENCNFCRSKYLLICP